MGRRAELTLAGLLLLAFLGAGLLIWGQRTGQITIFGDAVVTPATDPVDLSVASFETSSVAESFESLRYFDPTTTADWNIEAGELTLPYGATEGSAWSRQVATVTGEEVRVTVAADEDRPAGSSLYYAVSADGGDTWQPVSASQAAVFTTIRSADWRWRAYLVRGVASRPPAVRALTLTFTARTS